MNIEEAIEVAKEMVESEIDGENETLIVLMDNEVKAIDTLIKYVEDSSHVLNREIDRRQYEYAKGLKDGIIKGAEEGNKIAVKAIIENSQPRYICTICGEKLIRAGDQQ